MDSTSMSGSVHCVITLPDRRSVSKSMRRPPEAQLSIESIGCFACPFQQHKGGGFTIATYYL